MAAATSGNDFDRRFPPRVQRTNWRGVGCNFSLINGGKFLSQYSVFLSQGAPKSEGFIAQSGCGKLKILNGIGFSTATNLAGALYISIKKRAASRPSLYLCSSNLCPLNSRFPAALDRYVHGGCAIIKSHSGTQNGNPSCVIANDPGTNKLRTSPTM